MPAPDLDVGYVDRHLPGLSQKLRERGLEAGLVTCPVSDVEGEHGGAVVATNPAARERGMMRFVSNGSTSWEYDGGLGSAGISGAVDANVNRLRAAGVPSWPGPPS